MTDTQTEQVDTAALRELARSIALAAEDLSGMAYQVEMGEAFKRACIAAGVDWTIEPDEALRQLGEKASTLDAVTAERDRLRERVKAALIDIECGRLYDAEDCLDAALAATLTEGEQPHE